MAKTITTRLPDEYVSGINQIAVIENLDTSSIVRKLLAKSISEWKKDYAVNQYAKGIFSFEQAAKFSELSVWDFPQLLLEKNVPLNMDEEELEADLRAIGWKAKKKQ